MRTLLNALATVAVCIPLAAAGGAILIIAALPVYMWIAEGKWVVFASIYGIVALAVAVAWGDERLVRARKAH